MDSVVTLAVNCCGIDSMGPGGQQVFGYVGTSLPSRCMDGGHIGNRQLAAHRVADPVQLQDQIMPTGRQFDFCVLTVCTKNEYLHHFVFPQSVCGPNGVIGWWRTSIVGCANLDLDGLTLVEQMYGDPMASMDGCAIPM